MLCDLTCIAEDGVLSGTCSVPWNDIRAVGMAKGKTYVQIDNTILFVTQDRDGLKAEWEQWLQLAFQAEYPHLNPQD